MEGVPRLPMLGFALKSSDPVDFTTPLKSYISEFYSENADLYNKECLELDQLRKQALSCSVDFMGCSNMKKYFCQIEFLGSRFPISEGGSIQIPFTWEDTIGQQMVTFNDIKFEQANILFNIGCLHSKLGSMDNRITPEGMKVSCTHFQCAAWMFQHLRDVFDSFKCLDFNRDFLSFLSTTMLAQAQECILEKSMTDNRKSSITAKLSAQIVEYYKASMKHLTVFLLSISTSPKISKELKKKLDLKTGFYECITLYYMGLNAEEQSKWGERLSYMQAAITCLENLMRSNKLDDASVEESLKFMLDVVGGKFNSAKRDNDFIYHDKVPSLDSLPEIKGASLVRGIPLNVNDPEVSGQDIFKKLVPFVVHQKSSLYSEEKAKLLRKFVTNIELKDAELQNFLSLLQLKPDDQILPESIKIPDLLLEKCASMSVRQNTIKDLTDAMQALSSRCTEVECDLNSTLEIIEAVEKKMEETSTTSPSDASRDCEEVRKECKKYENTLKSISQLNEDLHGIMQVHISNLKLLSSPVHDVYAAISALQYSPSESELEILQDMKKLMDKVDQMMKQRSQMEEKLRDQLQKDDITQILVVASTDINFEELFREQIEKHSQQISLLNQNLAAQENILQALTDANANYAGVRKCMIEASLKQQTLIDNMIKSYEVYEDLLSKTQQGVDLYDKLSTHVSKQLEKSKGLFENKIKEAKLKEKEKTAVPRGPLAPEAMSNIVMKDSLFKPADISRAPLRLKDYLPFMKPDTFGSQSGQSLVLQESFSTPGLMSHISSNYSTSLPGSSPAPTPPLQFALPQPKFNPVSSLDSLNIASRPHASFHAIPQVAINPILHSHPPGTPSQTSTTIQPFDPKNIQVADAHSQSGNFPCVNQRQTDNSSFPNQSMLPVNPTANQFMKQNNSIHPHYPQQSHVAFPEQAQQIIDKRHAIHSSSPQHHQHNVSAISQPQQFFQQAHPTQQQHQQIQPLPSQHQYIQPHSTQHIQSHIMQQQLQPLSSQQLHIQPIQTQQQYIQPIQTHHHVLPSTSGPQQPFQYFIQPYPPLTANAFQPTLNPAFQIPNIQQPQRHQIQQPQQNLKKNLPCVKPPFNEVCNVQQLSQGPLSTSFQLPSPSMNSQQNLARFASPQHFPQSFIQAHRYTSPRHAASLPTNAGPSPSELGRNNSHMNHNLPIDQLRRTSLDEMLSGCNNAIQKSTVLIPKVITDEDLRREQNEEAKKNLKMNAKDPYANPEVLSRFVTEVEKFGSHVDRLTKPSLNKLSMLESEWKELNEGQEKSTKSFSMAIARCYPIKNRQQDIMPFDNSRIKLVGAVDDYINASLIKSTSLACPDIIATQAPLPVTFSDFWQMIYDYNVEVIVVLCSETEASTKGQVYWPTDKGQKATLSGNFSVTLHSIQVNQMWTERVIIITNSKSQVSRSVVHLNFHSWPPGAEPDNCDSLLQFIGHVHDLYLQQRSLVRPIVVHCSNGVGRTGTFAVIYTGVQEINQGSGIIDICKTISQMRVQKKFFVEFQRQLKFCYSCILHHGQNVLRNYGIQTMMTSASHNTLNSNNELLTKEATNVVFKTDLPATSPGNTPIHQQDNYIHHENQPSSLSSDLQPLNILPSSVADIQNPEKFSLDCKASKSKITRANFFNQSGLLGNKPSVNDSLDPLNELDPMWTMKK